MAGFNVPTELADSFVHIWHRQPPFMSVIMQAPLIIRMSEDVPTAACKGRRISFNPQFHSKLDYLGAAGVLLHEVLHFMQGHCELLFKWKKVGTITGTLKNGLLVTCPFNMMVAQHTFDTCVNDALKKNGVQLPDPHVHMPHLGGWFDAEDDTYVNVWHEYNQQGKLPPSNSSEPGEENEPPEGWDVIASDPDGPNADMQRKGEIVKQALTDLLTMPGRGHLAGEVERLIERLVPKRFPWTEVIKPRFQTLFGRRKPTWTTLNRGALACRQVMPGHVGTKAGKVMFVLDTSGSIDRIMQEHFVSNLMYMMEDCRPKELVVLEIDTFVRRESTFTNVYALRQFIEPMVGPHDHQRRGLMGGGGTDMCEAWTWMAAKQWVPDIVVVLTDGYTDFPDTYAPAKECVWVMTTDVVAPAHAGRTVRMWID
jgi:predicted metal-dependent peptidase